MDVCAFFEELDKIAADFKFLGPTAQSYAGTLKSIKAGGGTGIERAAYRQQNITKAIRQVKAQRGGGPAPVVQAAQNAHAGILAKMKQRVDPAMRSPQIAAAREAERAAASGRLQAGGRVKVSNVLAHGAELAGLATLAKPSYDDLRGHTKPGETESQRKRRHAKYELGGLGILAAPSAVELGKKVYQKVKTVRP